jgi:hypothetical protein
VEAAEPSITRVNHDKLGRVSASPEAGANLPADSPLSGLEPQDWSTQDSVNFEVAREILSEMMAIASRDMAQARQSGDVDRVEQLRMDRAGLAAELQALRSTDVERVTFIRETYGGRLRQRRSNAS